MKMWQIWIVLKVQRSWTRLICSAKYAEDGVEGTSNALQKNENPRVGLSDNFDQGIWP